MTGPGLASGVVLVTGGSGGIGTAIARRFAETGATVAVCRHSNVDAAGATAEQVQALGGHATTVRLDHADPSSITDAALDLERRLATVDVLVANAVTWPSEPDLSWQAFADSVTTNVAGPRYTIETVLPGMRENGIISSDVVDQPMPARTEYPAAKGALEAAARVLAVREARQGILTNVVRPGLSRPAASWTRPA